MSAGMAVASSALSHRRSACANANSAIATVMLRSASSYGAEFANASACLLTPSRRRRLFAQHQLAVYPTTLRKIGQCKSLDLIGMKLVAKCHRQLV